MNIFKKSALTVACLALLAIGATVAAPLPAATIYFGPTSTGSNNGANCANAYAWTDPTNGITGGSASWVAGNTLFICAGTYNCPAIGADSTILTKGGGTSGNPITIRGTPEGRSTSLAPRGATPSSATTRPI